MKLRMTCPSVPTQWEGTLDDGRYIYFRYRSGRATIDVAANEAACMYGTGGTTVWSADFRDERGDLDGSMGDAEVRAILESALGESIKEGTL